MSSWQHLPVAILFPAHLEDFTGLIGLLLDASRFCVAAVTHRWTSRGPVDLREAALGT